MSFLSNTDREWEKFGKSDPYFGVVSHDKFLKVNLTDRNKEEFFESGSRYVDDLLGKIKHHVSPAFTVKKALDFGCGVGRLTIPLANVAQEVAGLDVSDSMLSEARKNCDARSIGNVSLFKSDDSLSALKEKYDLIHSFIVFQHIPVTRGERIFENLLEHLENDGVCVVHFTYSSRDQTRNRLVSRIKNLVPFSGNLINLMKGKKFLSPQMQMNTYDLNRLFFTIQTAGVRNSFIEFTDHGGQLGVVAFFQK